MWGRLSSLGQNISEFTKEVITANEEEEDDEFYDGKEETASSPYSNNMQKESIENQLKQSNIQNTIPLDANNIAKQLQFECQQWKNKYEQLQTESEERIKAVTVKYESILKEIEDRHKSEQKELEQKISNLENMVRNKDVVISNLEKELLQRAARKNQQQEGIVIPEQTNSSVEEITQQVDGCFTDLQQSLFSLLTLDGQIEKDNEVTVILADQQILIEKWNDIFDELQTKLNENLNRKVEEHFQSSRQSSTSNQELNLVRQELNQICNSFKTMLANYNVKAKELLSTLESTYSDETSEESLKNTLYELMELCKEQFERQQYKLLEYESQQRQSQRQLSDVMRKFQFLYSNILQVCNRQQISLNDVPLELSKEGLSIDNIKMKDLMAISECLENALKTKNAYWEICSQVYTAIQHLLKEELKVRFSIPQDSSISDSIMNALNLLQNSTKELAQMNEKLMMKLSKLQSEQLKLLEENTDKERSMKQQLETFKQQQLKDLRRQIDEKDNAIDMLNRKLLEYDRIISQLQEKNNSLQQSYASLESNIYKSNELLEYQKEEQQNEKNQLLWKIQLLQSEITSYKEKERQAEIKASQLLNEINALKSKIDNYEDQLKQKEDALSNLEIVLGQFQTDSARDMKRLKLKISETEEAKERAEKKIQELILAQEEFNKLKQKDNSKTYIPEQKTLEITEDTKSKYEAMKVMLEDAVGRVNDENLVDRRIVIRLLLTLFDPEEMVKSIDQNNGNKSNSTLAEESSSEKRDDKVIALFCSTLRMDETQQKVIVKSFRIITRGYKQFLESMQNKYGSSNIGFGTWFKRNASASESSYENKPHTREKSLSKLWVQFLIEESTKNQPNT